MEGARQFIASLVLAQAASLPFPAWRRTIRTAAGLALGLLTLAPTHGVVSALGYPLLPIAAWLAIDAGLRPVPWPTARRVLSELAYLATVLGALAFYDATERAQLAAWLAWSVSPEPLAIAALYLTALFGGERLVRVAIAPYLAGLDDEERRALPRAGRMIGWTERFLVITLIGAGYGEPVGWLLAAKTAMRYPAIKDASTGRLGEYFFIGTLLSISIAVVAGMALRWLMMVGP